MKFLTAMTLGLLSLNALAMPVLTEDAGIFSDSKDFSKFYYIPDQMNVSIASTSGDPIFGLFSTEDGTGQLVSSFRVNKSKDLDKEIDYRIEFGDVLAKLPILNGYIRLNPKYETMLKVNENTSKVFNRTNLPVFFTADVTVEGVKTLSKELKDDPESVKLFSACYVVEGVSPDFSGSYAYNLNQIYNYFLKLPRTKATYKEVRDSIEYMYEQNMIAIDMFGDGERLDYIASVTRVILQTMFNRNFEQDSYTLYPDQVYADKMETHVLRGREYVRKDFCIKANLKDLKNYPRETYVD